MAWIKVTDPLGNPVYLSVEQLVRIRPCVAGIDFPAPDARGEHDRKNSNMALAGSIIDLVTGVQAVRETQEEILECIRNALKADDKDETAGA